jgi:predicted lipoprotein with Yx(FWY)xxD motif
MKTGRVSRFRAGVGAALVVGVAVIVAGCGSSSSSSSSAPAANASAPASAPATSGSPMTISTAKGPDGTYLTGASGRALYLWVADSGKMSVCDGACAKAWPPLTTTSTPAAGTGVNAADLGVTMRSDGAKQVTYKGHPLYYFVADPTQGSLKGQGSDSFGAKWWLVSPAGAAITSTGSATSAASSSSGGNASGSSSAHAWG